MKKQAIAYLLLLLIGAQMIAYFGYMKVDAKEPVVIPKEAIRLRILANSDSKEDQELKRKVRDEVKAQIDGWVEDLKSFEDARRIIQGRIPELEQTVANTLKREGSKDTFTVRFNKHIKFPTKVYGNFIYPAGEYEAVLVTIGKGEGANWWCVLFPPMCFLDFSSGTAVKREERVVKAETIDEVDVEENNLQKEIVKEEVKQSLKAKKGTNIAPKQNVKVESVRENRAEKELREQEEVKQEEPRTIQKEEQVKVVEEMEEKPEVKLFIVEAFTSLFSK
ncbi:MULTISPECIES: stage II sporulation protein R [unclassified Bacillus (in: firmicutes)]|uniref:stage II sporulation protein R n=1 Tax=unclassified Bacillus (in: firmicutes) TaxID=185979 RepID=UPI0008EE51B2|nr:MULTISPECIES: stage II sporulation protein R [unclassified Bacillus (in: firmicutes)]SFJ65989.1 stage II sporulation protein R [Bacillus sp. 71mf]SFT14199.1 stage II sporulation protein R [Bacillus sp. 103mf]